LNRKFSYFIFQSGKKENDADFADEPRRGITMTGFSVHPELEGFRLSRVAQSTFDTATYALPTFSPQSCEVHEGFRIQDVGMNDWNPSTGSGQANETSGTDSVILTV
jgi:hypothetical protein